MKSAMRFITVIIILLLLVSCVPTEARVQEAIMQTQAAQPTATSTPEPTATATAQPAPTNTPEPTATATPEYCGRTEYKAAAEKLSDIHNDNIARSILQLGNEDWLSERVKLTKLQREIDAIVVPGCLVYLKQLLSDETSDLISICADQQSGMQNQSLISRDNAIANMMLFRDEVTRLNACQPNCKP
jgi:hypothetical protein